MTLELKPKRGGFLRPFGCGIFIRDFLLGLGPYDSARINPDIGAPQADIFREYKNALRRITADDMAARQEEKQAMKANRAIDPGNIEALTMKYLEKMPYKSWGCRYSSYLKYFTLIKRLGWAEPSGKVEPSEYQDHYAPGQPRIYFRLSEKGKTAPDSQWANPYKTLYP